MKWRVGEVAVTKIAELEVTGASRFILPQADLPTPRGLRRMQPPLGHERKAAFLGDGDKVGRCRSSIFSAHACEVWP
jgi:hypothetical protein